MRRGLLGILVSATLILSGCGGDDEDEDEEEGPPLMSAAKLLIEHNATDADTGFQGFADGDPWDELEISGPGGTIVVARPQGGLAGFGLTEFFFETSEPPNADVPIADVLARLPEGTYTFKGKMVGGTESSATATFTHTIPAGPVLVAPAEGAPDVDPNNTVVSWQSVTKTYDGAADVKIVGYQVIVEKKEEPLTFPESFAKPVFSAYVPASATSVTVPKEFMVANALYDWEVLAIEESGNQTLSSGDFMTGAATDPPEVPHEFQMTQAKLLIEHNATDRDTGFQGFADGDPWNQLTLNPNAPLVVINAQGGFRDFGLTELFFETSEPENDEVPIADVLSRIPEGSYPFEGEMVGATAPSTVAADFTHKIPAGPVLVTPAADASDVDPQNTVISWQAVTQTVDGSSDIQIVGYQVIVEKDAEPLYPQGFYKPVFSVYLPATATSVTVPKEFMEAGAPYEFEVLAIEVSGNQTLSSAAFATR
jgi:hypothetical protein